MSEPIQEERSPQRIKRVRRLKQIIRFFFLCFLLLPTVLCIILFGRLDRLEDSQELIRKTMEQARKVENEILSSKQTENEQQSVILPGDDDMEGPEEQEQLREIYLTFDDGPSIYTDEILDILDEYGVKATFFVVGKEDWQYERMYRRIVRDGHTLGIHSFSHKYWEIYDSVSAFAQDMERMQSYLKDITGISPELIRFPGGSSNQVSKTDMQDIIEYVEESGFTYFDWNISSMDASSKMLPVQEIVKNCTEIPKSYKEAVILMHDAQDKKTTVEALPIIIEKLQEQENTVLLPITEDTKPVQHVKAKEK